MRICCIRHVGFEGPGIIADWAESKGYDFDIIKAWKGERFPEAANVDALVIMGGPMSANDDEKFDWLIKEKEFAAACVERNIPVIGICLGAQMMANVLGSKVYKNVDKEIGWFDVHLSPEGAVHPLTNHLPQIFNTFHWHGETFDLPSGATHLASSQGCRNQAYVYGKVLGLQFHMEMTEDGIEEVSERCAHELVSAPYIQQREHMLQNPGMDFNHAGLKRILDEWIRL